MSIEVTSVSKKEEKLFQSAAAIYVITQEEIRRINIITKDSRDTQGGLVTAGAGSHR